MCESPASRCPPLRSRGINIMINTRGLARLGMLAVGLGVGATVASTPGMASADTNAAAAVSADWWADLLALF